MAGHGGIVLANNANNPIMRMTGGQGRPFTPEQAAVIERAKAAKASGGISLEEAERLLDDAERVGLDAHGPEIHPGRNYNVLHIHIGPVDHITVIP